MNQIKDLINECLEEIDNLIQDYSLLTIRNKLWQVKEMLDQPELKQKTSDQKEENQEDQQEQENSIPNKDQILPEREQSQKTKNTVQGIRDNVQYILSYPVGYSIQEDSSTKSNMTIANEILIAVLDGYSVTIPTGWDLQVVHLPSKEASLLLLDQQHADMVVGLCKPGREIQAHLSGKHCHMIHMVLGISGEAGELLDAIKKNTIYQKELDVTNVIEELGDLEFFMQGLRASLGITREQTLEANLIKLRKRYGEKYSNESAIQRVDKEC